MLRKSNGISVMEISKSDWDLYKIKLPLWQEKYMEHLNCEYNDILNGSEKASEKFWKLAKRIQKDKKNAGVIVELDRKLAVKKTIMLRRITHLRTPAPPTILIRTQKARKIPMTQV